MGVKADREEEGGSRQGWGWGRQGLMGMDSSPNELSANWVRTCLRLPAGRTGSSRSLHPQASFPFLNLQSDSLPTICIWVCQVPAANKSVSLEADQIPSVAGCQGPEQLPGCHPAPRPHPHPPVGLGISWLLDRAGVPPHAVFSSWTLFSMPTPA